MNDSGSDYLIGVCRAALVYARSAKDLLTDVLLCTFED